MPYEAEGMKLKLWVVKEVEAELNRLSDGNGGKVGAVDFTYHNSWLIDMLKEKGDFIKWQEWDKLNFLNKEMTRRLHEDMAGGENALNDPANAKPCIVDPISAFVSMESEEAYNFVHALSNPRPAAYHIRSKRPCHFAGSASQERAADGDGPPLEAVLLDARLGEPPVPSRLC